MENRSPFGVLNLTKLVIKNNTNTTGIELSDNVITIHNGGKIITPQICDNAGTCINVSNINTQGSVNVTGIAYDIISDTITTANLTDIVTGVIETMSLIPDVNDATLTFTKWSETIETFSANADTNVTIDLEPIITGVVGNIVSVTPEDVYNGELIFKQWWTTIETFSANTGRTVTIDLKPIITGVVGEMDLGNPTLPENFTGIITGIVEEIAKPEDGTLTITQWSNTWYFSANTGTNVTINLATWGGWSSEIELTWWHGKRCMTYCPKVQIDDWEILDVNTTTLDDVYVALSQHKPITWIGCYAKCAYDSPSEWTNKHHTIYTKDQEGGVLIGTTWVINGNYKLAVKWDTIISPDTEPARDLNKAYTIFNQNGIAMFWAPDFMFTIWEMKMRSLNVNWPIVVWGTGNYIHMSVRWNADDSTRSYEIMWSNELAVWRSKGAFLYFKNLTWYYKTYEYTYEWNQNPIPDRWWDWYTLEQLEEMAWHTIPKLDIYNSLMVWVNTDNPQATLDVNGTLKIGKNCVGTNFRCDSGTAWTMIYFISTGVNLGIDPTYNNIRPGRWVLAVCTEYLPNVYLRTDLVQPNVKLLDWIANNPQIISGMRNMLGENQMTGYLNPFGIVIHQHNGHYSNKLQDIWYPENDCIIGVPAPRPPITPMPMEPATGTLTNPTPLT